MHLYIHIYTHTHTTICSTPYIVSVHGPTCRPVGPRTRVIVLQVLREPPAKPMYVYACIYIYIERERDIERDVYTYTYIYIYIYIQSEREREREGERHILYTHISPQPNP